MNCYYCDAKPVAKDAQGFVYVHKSECPILEIEVNKMVEEEKKPKVRNFYG